MALVLRNPKRARDLCAGDWIEVTVGGLHVWLEIKKVETFPFGETCWVAVWLDASCLKPMRLVGDQSMCTLWFSCDVYVLVAGEEMD